MSNVANIVPKDDRERRLWIVSLVKLAVPPQRREDAVKEMVGFLPYLRRVSDAAFNEDTMVAIAEVDRKGGYPLFADVSGALKAWDRENRPMPLPAAFLEGPKDDRVYQGPRSVDEIMAVRERVASVTGREAVPTGPHVSTLPERPEPHPPVRTVDEQLAILRGEVPVKAAE